MTIEEMKRRTENRKANKELQKAGRLVYDGRQWIVDGVGVSSWADEKELFNRFNLETLKDELIAEQKAEQERLRNREIMLQELNALLNTIGLYLDLDATDSLFGWHKVKTLKGDIFVQSLDKIDLSNPLDKAAYLEIMQEAKQEAINTDTNLKFLQEAQKNGTISNLKARGWDDGYTFTHNETGEQLSADRFQMKQDLANFRTFRNGLTFANIIVWALWCNDNRKKAEAEEAKKEKQKREAVEKVIQLLKDNKIRTKWAKVEYVEGYICYFRNARVDFIPLDKMVEEKENTSQTCADFTPSQKVLDLIEQVKNY